jgi:hypothetical protein
MLVGFGAILGSASILEYEPRRYALRAANLTLGITVVCWALPRLMWVDYRVCKTSAEQVVIAEQLRAMCIEPADRVALIGNGFEENWARLEKVRIVAEVPNIPENADSTTAFWESSQEIEQKVLNILKSTGAKAVVAATPPRVLPPGWVLISNTGHAVYFFR